MGRGEGVAGLWAICLSELSSGSMESSLSDVLDELNDLDDVSW